MYTFYFWLCVILYFLKVHYELYWSAPFLFCWKLWKYGFPWRKPTVINRVMVNRGSNWGQERPKDAKKWETLSLPLAFPLILITLNTRQKKEKTRECHSNHSTLSKIHRKDKSLKVSSSTKKYKAFSSPFWKFWISTWVSKCDIKSSPTYIISDYFCLT